MMKATAIFFLLYFFCSFFPVTGQGKKIALCIGTNNYRDSLINDLYNAVPDAESVACKLHDSYGFDTIVLKDPARLAFLDSLKKLSSMNFEKGDQVLIFIAGNAHYDEMFKEGYLYFNNTVTEAGESFDTMISFSMLRTILDLIPADHIFVILDVCYAGAFDPASRISKNKRLPSGDNYKAPFSRIYLASCGLEYTPDGTPGEHSPFTRRLLKVLDEQKKDGIITAEEMTAGFTKLSPYPVLGKFGSHQGCDFLIKR